MPRDSEISGSHADTDGQACGRTDNKNNGQLKLLLFPETEAVSIEGIDENDSRRDSAEDTGSEFNAMEMRVSGMDALHDEQMSVGTRLRLAREQHGWSREEVAARLKLQAGLIKRLEEENYEGIAHTVYLRGYLTSYARLLGLPTVIAETVVAKSGHEMPLISTGTISRSRYMLDRYSVSATYLVLTGLVIGPAVWLATHGGLEQKLAPTLLLDSPTTTISSAAPQVAASDLRSDLVTTDAVLPLPNPAPSVSLDSPAPIIASMAPFASMPSPIAPVTEAVPAGSRTMTIKLKQASWVEVTSASGQKLEYGLLAAGTERKYTSTEVVSVRIGNAEAAEITADGKVVDLAPFRRANVAHLKMFAAGSVATRADS